MQDILLIQPPVGPLQLYTQPLSKLSEQDVKWHHRLTRVPQGLLSIGSWLEQHGFSVKIFDCRLHMNSLEQDLKYEIRQTQLFVGISVLTMHINIALQISKLVAKENPGVLCVWGGFHPTLYPEQTCRDPLVSCVIEGEGEIPLLELAKVRTKNRALKKVSSLVYKVKGVIRRNKLAAPFDINMIKHLNYGLLELEHYLTKQSYNPDETVRGLEYNGSRGCCYSCAFCINRVLPQQRVWRGRTPSKIAADITYLKDKYNLRYIFFEEELPFIRRKRSIILARKLRHLDLRWYANIRVDTVHNDRELLETLRRSGWSETSVGAESGNNRVLKYLKKGITVEQTLQTAQILNELDVYCLYSFMTDLPTETTAEKMDTFNLMRRLRRIHPKSEFIGPQAYRLYPKTEWYNQLVAEGKFNEPKTLREWVSSGLATFYAQ